MTAGFDPPLEHIDTRSSSHMGPVVYTTPQLLLHPTTLQAAILMLYSVSGWSPVNVKDVSVVFSVPLTPSIAGSVVIWYCIVDNSPVGTQERDMVESVLPFSVTLDLHDCLLS